MPDGKLGHRPCGADETDLAPYKAMSRDELEQYAFVVDGQLRAVIQTVHHWRGSEERTAAQGYIAPFRYSLAELAVTNVRRSGAADYWRAKTHCPRSHPYDEKNTGVTKRGGRICRACARDRMRERRAARRPATPLKVAA